MVCRFFFLVFVLLSRVVSQPRTSSVGPDIPGIILLCDVKLYLACVYTRRVLLLLFLTLWTGVVAAAAAAVRRRVPDGKNCCWFIKSDSIKCFISLHSNTMYLYCMHPLAVLSLLRPRFAYITSSLIAGMHGAKAAVKPRDANKK